MSRLRTVGLAVALATAMLFTAGSGATAAADPPERIVSLSPTATEMLFAIGAGDQVVAVDDQSSFPVDAPVTDLSGYTPNVESIAGYDPDLVVVPDGQVRKALEDLGIQVLVLPAATRLAGAYSQIRRLGRVTGHAEDAKALVGEMRADIADLAADVPDAGTRPSTYYELDETYFSADSSTFIGKLLELGGFDNIADEAKNQSPGYPQLSSEYIVDSNPDAVFLADTKCCGQTPQTFGERPGFDALTAVEDGHVVSLDDDIASRWGPRVVELLRQIVKERNRL
ncbi:MAG: ABC transporter substrate-binding protein [Acidimicrobiia bacterium]